VNNKQINDTIQKIENYLKTTIEKEYPFTIKRFIDYDKQDEDFVGIFEASTGKYYSFIVEKDDGLPMIKPITVKQK
jgi:hypothetical protein